MRYITGNWKQLGEKNHWKLETSLSDNSLVCGRGLVWWHLNSGLRLLWFQMETQEIHFFMCQKLRKEKKFTSEETKAEIQSALDYEQVSLILH